MNPPNKAFNFDLETVRQVAELLRESELTEISIESTGDDAPAARLLLRRAPSTPPAAAPASPENPAVEQQGEFVNSDESSIPQVPVFHISSPAVGVFRPAKIPVKAGDQIKAKQLLGCVESLRLPNDIVAAVAGRVVELGAQDGQGVEYGQTLFVIEETA